MITSRDIKIEEIEDRKLKKSITTNTTRPKGFMLKGKGAPRNRTVITTADLIKAGMEKNKKKKGKKK